MRRVLARLSVIALAIKFVLDGTGRAQGIDPRAKLALVAKLFRNVGRTGALTSLQKQLVLVRDIVGVLPSVEGDVVECGCFEGGSTVALSLACALTHRRLFVCDTFEGLPRPKPEEALDVHPDQGTYYRWEEGEFRAPGGLEGVRENIRLHGDLDACRFVVGLYEDTLPQLETNALVLVFEDADLPSSVRDCLEHLWPKLQPGCRFYSDEPWSIAVVSLFYDRDWWHDRMHSTPPGFFGSGGGVDYALSSSGLGFAIKFDAERIEREGQRILHAGSKGFPSA